MRHAVGLLLCAASVGLASACASAAVHRQVQTLDTIVQQAAQRGAGECAPEELALARVHIEFARSELDQGESKQAARHLVLAEPNAKAALRVASKSCRRNAFRAQHRNTSRPLVAVGRSRDTDRFAP